MQHDIWQRQLKCNLHVYNIYIYIHTIGLCHCQFMHINDLGIFRGSTFMGVTSLVIIHLIDGFCLTIQLLGTPSCRQAASPRWCGRPSIWTPAADWSCVWITKLADLNGYEVLGFFIGLSNFWFQSLGRLWIVISSIFLWVAKLLDSKWGNVQMCGKSSLANPV